jgi:hypothetical protein
VFEGWGACKRCADDHVCADSRPGCQRSKVEQGVVGGGLHVDAMYYIGRSRRRVGFGDIMECLLQLWINTR